MKELSLRLAAVFIAVICLFSGCAEKEEPVSETDTSIPETETVTDAEPEEEPETLVFEKQAINIEDVFSDANEEHRKYITEPDYTGYEEFIPYDEGFDVLSEAEIKMLVSEKKEKSSVSKEEALEDTDLLFRIFRSTFGEYQYFGKENFENAEKEMLAVINETDSITFYEYESLAREKLSFINDRHSGFGGGIHFGKSWYSYLTDDISLNIDDKGYYAVCEGEKWYYISSSNNNVFIGKRLRSDGAVDYSPVLWIEEDMPCENYFIILENELGEKYEHPLTFYACKNFSNGPIYTTDYSFTESGNTAFLTVRNFTERDNKDEMKELVAGSKNIPGHEIFIMDTRSNGGGSCDSDKWFRTWLGKIPKYDNIFIKFNTRYSKYMQGFLDGKLGTYSVYKNNGKYVKNENMKIFVLMDQNNGSAGEEILRYMKAVENTVMVGSNSGGWVIGGNAAEFYLPNTGMFVGVSSKLEFISDLENVDGKGYAPDLWCDPSESVESVCAMIKYYNLSSPEDADAITSYATDIGAVDLSNKIMLQFNGFQYKPNSGFGDINKTNIAEVFSKGKQVTDFTVLNENPEYCDIYKGEDGKIHIDKKVPSQVASFTVTVGIYSSKFKVYTQNFK